MTLTAYIVLKWTQEANGTAQVVESSDLLSVNGGKVSLSEPN